MLAGEPKVAPIGSTPADTESLASRQFQVEEVARIYGVPPAILGQNSNAYGAAIESLTKGFYKFGIRQHIDRMIRAAEVKLLPNNLRFEIDPTSLLRGDADAVSKLIMALGGTAQNPPVATIPEMRKLAGLPQEGGPQDRAGVWPCHRHRCRGTTRGLDPVISNAVCSGLWHRRRP